MPSPDHSYRMGSIWVGGFLSFDTLSAKSISMRRGLDNHAYMWFMGFRYQWSWWPLLARHRNIAVWRSIRKSSTDFWDVGFRRVIGRPRFPFGNIYATVQGNHHGVGVHFSNYRSGGLVVCWMIAWQYEQDEVDDCNGGWRKFWKILSDSGLIADNVIEADRSMSLCQW